MRILALIPLLMTLTANAGRYTEHNTAALSSEQEAPLTVVMTISFPREVETVGDAINYALANSGYKLAFNRNTPDLSRLVKLPLPGVHRTFQGTQLSTLLVGLGKPAYRLIVDDVNRLVSYEISPEYKQ